MEGRIREMKKKIEIAQKTVSKRMREREKRGGGGGQREERDHEARSCAYTISPNLNFLWYKKMLREGGKYYISIILIILFKYFKPTTTS